MGKRPCGTSESEHKKFASKTQNDANSMHPKKIMDRHAERERERKREGGREGGLALARITAGWGKGEGMKGGERDQRREKVLKGDTGWRGRGDRERERSQE